MIGQTSKMFCLFICPHGKMKLLNIGAWKKYFKFTCYSKLYINVPLINMICIYTHSFPLLFEEIICLIIIISVRIGKRTILDILKCCQDYFPGSTNPPKLDI